MRTFYTYDIFKLVGFMESEQTFLANINDKQALIAEFFNQNDYFNQDDKERITKAWDFLWWLANIYFTCIFIVYPLIDNLPNCHTFRFFTNWIVFLKFYNYMRLNCIYELDENKY